METSTAIPADCVAITPEAPDGRRCLAPAERQQVLLDHLPEVRHIARRIHLRLPPHVPFDDLVHSGVVGLIDAVEKFDPAKNVLLRSYARFRIRGAILDSLRELDWSPRHLRRQARRIERARSDLATKLGRSPSESEIATHLGFRPSEFQHLLAELHWLAAGTWQAQPEFMSCEEEPAARCNRMNEDPFELCARAEITRMLSEAISTLDEKERRALALYYFEEHNMKEVGRVLNVCESRVSQIISRALVHLRARLQ